MQGAHKITLLLLLALSTMAHAASATASSRVVVVVREQQALEQQGSDVLLKVRLSPGVSAMVWVDASCDLPNENATTITRSGSYVLPIANLQSPGIQGRGNAYSCIVSSDGRLNAAVPIQ